MHFCKQFLLFGVDKKPCKHAHPVSYTTTFTHLSYRHLRVLHSVLVYFYITRDCVLEFQKDIISVERDHDKMQQYEVVWVEDAVSFLLLFPFPFPLQLLLSLAEFAFLRKENKIMR